MFATLGSKETKPVIEAKARAEPSNSAKQPSEPKSVWQSLATRLPIQRKLYVSQSHDPHEQEADRIADQVMQTHTADANGPRLEDSQARVSNPSLLSGAPVMAQRKCGQCEEEEENKVQRKPAGADGPATVAQPLMAPTGKQIDARTRAFMEPRLNSDFSNVRIHTDDRADASARQLNALAFTLGRDVAFRAGQYEPHTERGRRLLAHELVHVMQQSPVDPQRTADAPTLPAIQQAEPGFVQRQPAGPDVAEEATTGPSVKMIAGAADLKVADAAVRDFFGSLITGAGVQPSQFKVVEEEKFGKAIPNAKEAIPKLLLKMFLNPDSNIAHNILRFHGVGAFLGPDPVKRLTSFIEERIKAGFFAFNDATSEVRLTPEQLVARETMGVATGSEQRAQRQIVVQPVGMSTLVHELMHFYTHPTYLAEVAKRAEVANKAVAGGKPGTTHFGGVLLSEALIEGVTEHFAQQVMRAREKQLGEAGGEAYSTYVGAIEKLAEVSGEHTLRLAYFQGDKQAIARLYKNVEIFNSLLAEGNFSADKIVEIHHLHEPLGASWFQ
jgi:hypothetical protein